MGSDIVWVSFDADYIGGLYTDNSFYNCVRKCKNCSIYTGRPKKQAFSVSEMISNTEEMINLVKNISFQSIYMRQCHASIVDLLHNGDIIYNIDSHHDKYTPAYTKKDVDCGNWVNWAINHNMKVFNNYSPEKTLRCLKRYKNKIFRFFICTSPNYCSPETDTYLVKILHNIKGKINVDLTK